MDGPSGMVHRSQSITEQMKVNLKVSRTKSNFNCPSSQLAWQALIVMQTRPPQDILVILDFQIP